MRVKKWTIALGVITVLVGVLGAAIFGCSWLARYEIKKAVDKGVVSAIVVDSKDASGYKAWSNNYHDHAILYQDFYLYNLTNLEDMKTGAMPVVKQLGPYTYWAKKEYIDVDFKDGGNLAEYTIWSRWEFLPEESCDNCSESDVVFNINPAYIGALSQAGGELELLVGFTGASIKKVFDFLWDTFTNDMIAYWRPDIIVDAKNAIIASINGTQPENRFYSIWANSTVVPPQNATLWKGMIVSLNNGGLPSGISLSSAAALWNADLPYSLANVTWESATIWRQAVQGEQSAVSLLASSFGLTAPQVSVLAGWLTELCDPLIVNPNLTKSFAVQNVSDLAYLQWGQGTVAPGGASVMQLYPERKFPSPPEISLWYKSIGDPFSTLDLATSKKLLSGDEGIFDVMHVADLVAAYEALDWSRIKESWGLDEGEAFMFMFYFADMTYNYATVDLQEIFDQGGGLWTNHTVHQWLWDVTDPLLAVIAPEASQAALVFNETTEDVARKRHPPNLARTGKDDIKKIGEYILWQGLSSLPKGVYSEEVPVTGTNDAGQFAPWLDKHTVLETWDSNYARVMALIATGKARYHGIDMLRFELVNETWAPSYLYNQPIRGFCNLTGLHNGSTVFISNPHMYGADPTYVNKVTPMAQLQNREFDTVVIDIEPHLGTVMHYEEGLQINIYLDPKNKGWFNYYNRQAPTDVFVPVMIAHEYSTLREKDAKMVKDSLYMGIKMETTIFYVALGVGIGMMVAFVPLTGIFVWKFKKDRRSLDQWGYEYLPVSVNT